MNDCKKGRKNGKLRLNERKHLEINEKMVNEIKKEMKEELKINAIKKLANFEERFH